MKCSVFATIATSSAWNDLFGLMWSLSKNHPRSDLYLRCDNEIEEKVRQLSDYLPLTIHTDNALQEFSGKNRAYMEAEGSWLRFMAAKADVMLAALESNNNVLFLDCDIVVLRPIYIDERANPDIALSPHFIRKEFIDEYGYFNGGVFWSKSIEAVKRWRDLMPASRYYDQACLENIAREFRCHELDKTHNLSWWRIYQSDQRPGDELNRLSINSIGELCFDDVAVNFVHTHFSVQEGTIGAFNREIIRLVMTGSETWLKILLLRLARGHFDVFIPLQPRAGIWNHRNDSFRELAQLWQEAGLCQSHEIDNNHCWFGHVGGVALYDRPTFEWWDDEIDNAEMVLCGNVRPIHEKCRPWIFWPRRPRIYNETREKLIKESLRTNESVFIGNVENDVQERYRSSADWSTAITDFSLINSTKHVFSQQEYLQRLANSKFGLCLRGYGAKCHREVELMGLGVVPVVTREVDVSSYLNPISSDHHYLSTQSPEGLAASIQVSEHERMQRAEKCLQWYEKYCSVKGSFLSTLSSIFR